MTRVTLVALRITDDQDERDWWTALGLPPPEHWNDPSREPAFPTEDAFVKILVEERIRV